MLSVDPLAALQQWINAEALIAHLHYIIGRA
jgi:hypothetical protein